MIHNGTCEGILGIGVDVHLDHAVIQGLANFFKKASTAAMKHQIHLSLGTIFGDDGGLTILEDLRPQLDGTGLVVSMHVAESRCKGKTANRMQGFVDCQHVLRGGVKMLFGGIFGARGTVFLTSHNTGFHFEDDLIFCSKGQVFLGKSDVLIQWQDGGIQHVVLEQVVFATSAPCCRCLNQGLEKGIRSLGLAVVGVQPDEHIILFSQSVGYLGQDDGSLGGVLVVQS